MQRFETKYDLLNAAYSDEKLKKGTISLLQYLVHKSNKEKCFPAVDTIAKALNVCKRTVQYNMRKLEKAGYIIRKDRWYQHQQLTNQYIFNLGVVEELQDQDMYDATEKDGIDSCINNQEHRTISKVKEISKIYEMNINGYEKLLIINLIHRANQNGITYRTEKQMMKDIGVSRRTLIALLNALRSKKLIMVRNAYARGREIFVIKLTGNMWTSNQEKEVFDKEIKNNEHIAQRISADQNQEKQQVGRNRQSAKRKDRIRKESIWNKILKKCKGVIQFGIEKIRLILRL